MRLLLIAARLVLWIPILLTPLLGVWLASSWAAWANGPRWAVVLAGALLFPILPVLWELLAARRRRNKLSRAREGSSFLGRMSQRKASERVTSPLDRVLLRTLVLNGAFLAVLLVGFPRQTLTAVGARGDWMLDDVSGPTAARVRSVLRTLSDGLQDYNADFNDNDYAQGADDDRLPEQDTVAVGRRVATQAELTLTLPEGATGQLGSHVFSGSKTLTLKLQPTVLGVRFEDGQRLSCPVDPTAGTLALVDGSLGNTACDVLVEPDPSWRPAIHDIAVYRDGTTQLRDRVIAPEQVAAVHRNDPWLRVELVPEAHATLCEATRERRGYYLAVVVEDEVRFVRHNAEPLCDGFLPLDTDHPFAHEEAEELTPDEGGGVSGWPFTDVPDPRVHAIPSDQDDSIALLGHWMAANEPREAERARLVHDWIAVNVSYDNESLKPGQRAPQDADTVFRRRTGVCAGYANLYRSLGQAAGLDVVYLVGNVRDERGGMAGSSHAWNAVKVDGHWLLVDVTWDAGFSDEDTFSFRYRSSYLFTPPETFRLDHLPREAAWQLHDAPLSRGDFLRQPQLRVTARAMGIDMIAPDRPQIEASGSIDVQLDNPEGHRLLARIDETRCQVHGTERITCPVASGGNQELRVFAAPTPTSRSFVHIASVSVQGS